MDNALALVVPKGYDVPPVEPRKKAVAAYLNRLLEDRGWKIVDLMEKVELSRSAISKHVNGVEFPGRSSRKHYATAFGFPNVDVFDNGWRFQKVPQSRPAPDEQGIPVLSEIPAGNGDADPTFEGMDNGLGVDYISRAAVPGITDPLAYALKVVGDSMNRKYPEGTTVICSPSAPKESGKVYAIRFGAEMNNECTIKRLIDVDPDDEDVILECDSTNPAHKPRKVKREYIVRMDRVMARIIPED